MSEPDRPSGNAGTDAESARPQRSDQSGVGGGEPTAMIRPNAPGGQSPSGSDVGSSAGRPTGPAAAGTGGRGRTGEVAAATLARLTVLPALLIIAWLLPGLPLLLARTFQPLPMLLISVPLAVALTVSGLRLVPATWPRLTPGGPGSSRSWVSWFGLLATVAVVAGLTAWQFRENSASVVVLRDPGAYLQTGYWVAQHGSLPIPQTLRAFGGAHPGLSFASTGFYARGTSVVPGVTSGLPMLLSMGFWAHATTGAIAIGPIFGGLAALSFAGLVARLVGPQWAPAGALVLGLSLPQQYVSRSTLGEPALQILLFGGLCLLTDSLVLGWSASRGAVRIGHVGWRGRPADWLGWLTPPRALAGLAGLTLGFSLLVSLDGLIYLLPVVPFCGALFVAHRPQALPFPIGIVIGAGYGVASWYLLSRPLISSVGEPVALVGVVAVWLVALCVITTQLMRIRPVRRWVPKLLAKRPLRWLPELGALLVIAVLIAFAVRPYVQTVRGHPSAAVYHFIASLQRMQGLHVDPTRQYAEQTLYWVIWYIGLPTVLLGAFGAALLARRTIRAVLTWRDSPGVWRTWGLPLAIICAGCLVVLWHPAIVPDQPWASRRLVVIVLPGLIICGLWGAAWLTGWARDRGARSATAIVAGLCVAAMLVPTAATTFGVGFTHSGRGASLRPVVKGLALRRTGAGEADAVSNMCAQIPRDASVVILDAPTAQHFAQVIRGMCGVPTGSMVARPAAAVHTVIGAIAAAGRRPILLASRPASLAGFGGSPVRVLDLATEQDPHQLTQPPSSPTPIRFVIWMTTPSPTGVGA